MFLRVTIHSNIDRGLAAINIGNSGRPWTLKRTRLEIWEQKSWVEQWTLWKSSFAPIHLFISTPQVLQLKTTPTLVSYSNSFPTSFSFFSISFNHSLSMHSVHFLPNLELDISRIVDIWGALITTLHCGTNTSFLCSTGTQNSGSSSPIHPSCLASQTHVYRWNAGAQLWDLLFPMFSDQCWGNSMLMLFHLV